MAGLFDKTPLRTLLNNLKALSEGEMFVELLSKDEVQKFIVKLNTDQLKLEFVNSDGVLLSDIGGGYSDYTLSLGGKKGKFSVDLYDTGKYQKSFRIENITITHFEINSDPVKEDGTNLLEEWGQKVEGLTVKSLDEAARFLIPLYQELIRKRIING